MPLMIEEMLTSLEVQDQEKLRELIRAEVEAILRSPRSQSGRAADPADPAAAGRPLESGR